MINTSQLQLLRRGALCLALLFIAGAARAQQSVARQWDEEILNAIRHDNARPPVHARNLFHLSICMWDAWAAYEPSAPMYLADDRSTTYTVKDTARGITMSYAAYRFLGARYAASVGTTTTLNSLDARMDALGLDKRNAATVGATAIALGNRIAVRALEMGLNDGANEAKNFAANNGYKPVNEPLIVVKPGNPTMTDPNRWQPLALKFFVDQSGNPVATGYPAFICPHWGGVTPFGLTAADRSPVGNYLDPGPPPQLNGLGDAEYKAGHLQVLQFSSYLTPDDGVTMDISPGVFGNNPLGTNDGTGHPLNPATGIPYASNVVKRGDFARVLAEFWADGPNSETPPGHWNTIANYVSDQLTEKRIGGTGPILNDLEWDVKMYLALNGAVHDAAVCCWGNKGYYDSSRPISALRYMADRGQSSDPLQPSYNPAGIPLVPGLVEVITAETTAPGQRHEALAGNEGKIAFYTWPGAPSDPLTQYSGVRWILAENWSTYQLPTFVTPPFAGYFSGHSTFSRSAAEVMTRFTGSEYFPGGLGEYVIPANTGLKFELGPTTEVRLQWGTYYDAADQAGISRIYGGIHPYFDDFTGRTRGALIGVKAWERAQYFFGLAPSPTPSPTPTESFTPTPTDTATDTPTATPTATPSPTLSTTPTATPSPTATASPTVTASPTPSPTQVPTELRLRGFLLGYPVDSDGLDVNGDGVIDIADMELLLEMETP